MSITYPPEMLPAPDDENASVTSGGVEVRYKNGAIDEIIAKGGVLHIEQMSTDGWYMGLGMPDGSYWQFWFGAKNRRSHVEFRHTETTPAESAYGQQPPQK